MTLPSVVRSGVDAFALLSAAPRDAESGHHFVEDQQRAVLRAQLAQALEIARQCGSTSPMLPGYGSTITAAIASGCASKARVDGGRVVEGQHDRVARGRPRSRRANWERRWSARPSRRRSRTHRA